MKCEEKIGDMCKKAIAYNKFVKTDHCEHCCYGCKHATEMTCSGVCRDIAEYYYPNQTEEEGK